MKLSLKCLNLVRRLVRRGPYAAPRMARGGKVILVPFEAPASASTFRTAVVLHIYHADMAALLRRKCDNVPAPCDILITTDAATKAEVISNAFSEWGGGSVDIKVVPNRGRDMLSKFVAFAHCLPRYDLALFLHSKKSLHLDHGLHDWSDVLIDATAGSKEIVSSILALFRAEPSLGIVFPDYYDRLRPLVHWGENRRRAGLIASRMGVSLRRARALEYPAGSMFWARPAALAPLLELNLRTEDFDLEAGQIDGTLAHTLERLILFSAEKAGFRWLKTVTARCYRDRGNRVAVRPGVALDELIHAATAHLLRA